MRSFKQAAGELAVTASAVSHRIRALEEEIGRRLFARKTRAVELTPEGRSLYSAVRDGFDTIASGVEKVRQRARPLVKLSTHAGGCEGGRLVSSHADSFRLGATVPVDLTLAAWARIAAADLNTEGGIRYYDESHAIQAAVVTQGVRLLSLVSIEQELKLSVLESRSEPVLDGLAYYIVRPERTEPDSAASIVEAWLIEQAAFV